MRFSKLAAAVISLIASGTLLAQSAPPKQTEKSGGTTVAQAPAPAGGASKGVPAESEGDEPGTTGVGTILVVGIAIAAVAAAAGGGGGGGSSTTQH
jgi:hypothetical protein